MKSGNKTKIVINILVGIIIGLASRYVVDYLYARMQKGGLAPTPPFTHTDNHGNLRRTDVYLLPFSGFSETAAAEFAKGLSHDLGIVVKTTGAMPVPEAARDTERDQFMGERLYPSVYSFSRMLRDTKPETVYIAILADDMYPEHTTWNYCFALNFKSRISIIATDRLLPSGFLGTKKAGALYGERLYKLLKRTIGLQFYGYKRSSDPQSLLFSPVMGVDALDRMSMDLSPGEQANAGAER